MPVPKPKSPISREGAAAELLARREARRSLDKFVSYMGFPSTGAAHHQYLIGALEDVVSGKCPRLMVFMPPGSAKSTIASVYLPAYFLGVHPDRVVIAASYNTELAKGFGRRVRRVVGESRWKTLFGGEIETDQSAADNWATTLGGQYYAAGMNAGITGKRADLVCIDDPIKGREDADSPTIRNKVWETYKADVRTRLKPGNAIVLIMTRWHEDDLAGRILPEDYSGESGNIEARDGELWRVVSIPAIAEDADVLGRKLGEALWPEWWPEGFFDQEKISQGPRNWASLYQQRPAPEEGAFFERGWINFYDELPANLSRYGASDFAVTADGGDYTVHGVVGVDELDDMFVIDWWRGQTDSGEWVEREIDMANAHQTLSWFEESGQIAKAVGPLIERRQRERRAYFHRQQFVSSTDKPTRAQSIRGRMAQGKVFFPRNAPWVEPLVSELLTFPSGRYDDQVDVMSLFGRALSAVTTPKPKAKTSARRRERYDPLTYRP